MPRMSPMAILPADTYRRLASRVKARGEWRLDGKRVGDAPSLRGVDHGGTGPAGVGRARYGTGEPMQFGVFAEQMRRGANQSESLREMLDMADAGEAWGLDVYWLAEMLVNPARSVL